MLVGEPSGFAIESKVTRAYESLSLRALGYFVIHVLDRSYGIKAPDATMLANSFDEVGRRLTRRGKHNAPFAESPALDIAQAYIRAIYLDHEEDELFLGMTEAQFSETIYSNRLIWAPDGDEAFDDGSYVMAFDIEDGVRLIAFQRPGCLVDPAPLGDAWVVADEFYGILQRWRDTFSAEWESSPKAKINDNYPTSTNP